MVWTAEHRHLHRRETPDACGPERVRMTERNSMMAQATNILGKVLWSVAVSAAVASAASADITFTQTVDGWAYNKYDWDAQTEVVLTKRTLANVGDTKRVCARVVQKNGSQVGTEVFETTATKVAGGGGLVDHWRVDVPAGSVEDSDFWDADRLGVEIVECPPKGKVHADSQGGVYGTLRLTDYVAGDENDDPIDHRVSISAEDWDSALLVSHGFDFAVYAYQVGPGAPVVLNHLDELGLTTFGYDALDAFGSGQPYDIGRLRILGINLDPSWDAVAQQSDGLNMFQWNLQIGGGQLMTDQGVFQIMQVQPLTTGWQVYCPADLNQDGAMDFFDVQMFLAAFSAQQIEGDWNGDGLYDFFDVQEFLADFSAGCPVAGAG
jgi:hypothetical protein